MKNKFDNRDRFTGSASLYHESRPRFPQEALRILLRYLEEKPIDAVDLGCGTGLSTAALAEISETVIGVDPNADMLAQAGSYLSAVPESICFAGQRKLFHWRAKAQT